MIEWFSMNNHIWVIYFDSLKRYAFQKDIKSPTSPTSFAPFNCNSLLNFNFQTVFYKFLRRVWVYWIGFVPELGQGVALKLDDLVDFHKYQTLDSHQLKNMCTLGSSIHIPGCAQTGPSRLGPNRSDHTTTEWITCVLNRRGKNNWSQQ